MCWQPQLALPKLERSSARSTGAAAVVSRAERGVGVSASPVTHNASFFFSESYPSFPCFSFNLSFFCSCPALVLALCPPGERRACIYNHEHVFTLLPLLTLCSTGQFNINYDSGRPAAPNFLALLVDARRYRPTRSSCLPLAACIFSASQCGRRVAREKLAQYGSKALPRSLGSQRQEPAEVCSLFVLWKPFSQFNNVLGAARVLL